MPKPIAALFIGDLHAGSDTGLCVPGHLIGSKQKRPYIASGDQQWLYERWGELLKAVKARAKGHLLFVGLGGDMIDGVQHHNTTQTSGTYSDQVSMARELVKPFVGLADYAYGVLGTAAHVGDVGDNDAALYESLGIDYAASYRLQIGGRVLWWAHHGIPVGTRQHTLENGAMNMARDIELTCRAQGVVKPSAIVGHDRHRAFEPVTVRGISIGVCPCWQMSTYYGLSRWPHSSTTVGALWWDVSSNHLELITYAKEPNIIRVGSHGIERRTTARSAAMVGGD